jgi:hypothetical protein
MLFHRLFAASLLMPRRFQLFALTTISCSLSAIGVAFQPQPADLWAYSNRLLMEFLAGVWLPEIVQRRKTPSEKIAVVMLFIGLAGFLNFVASTPARSLALYSLGKAKSACRRGAIAFELHRRPAIHEIAQATRRCLLLDLGVPPVCMDNGGEPAG